MANSTARSRLLLIDDDLAFCRLLTRIAEGHGLEVVATDDPEHFRRTALNWDPSLIIMDLQMPEIDGIELLRELALGKCTAEIVLTSGLDLRTLDSAMHLGTERGLNMQGVLQKPVAVEDLDELMTRQRKPDESALLAGDLAQAIVSDQLLLQYQPKINSTLGRIAGVEALVRWHHPRLGTMRPDLFIPLAESGELIDPLTNWVFTTATKQAAEWHKQGLSLDVSINVSAKNLQDIRLPDRFARQCEDFGVNPHSITLEVTETAAMHDAIHMMDVLTRLRVKGFKLSIDDFGTGYSSLVQLRKMPFSEIKIDLSFVTQMLTDKDSQLIVEAIVGLGTKLGLETVAEGVESEAIWAALLELGCDRGQGYYLGRPTSADRIELAATAAEVAHNDNSGNRGS